MCNQETGSEMVIISLQTGDIIFGLEFNCHVQVISEVE